mmetsp:Transcript_10852/g.15998  ORF Transcript_10852/g.15998 Transcript_10852/m.15998 type:complete len:139 (+) Transcript_10852:181-597(+)
MVAVRRVSFQSIVEIHEFATVSDAQTKSKLYYTEHELKIMKIEAKSMVLERYIQQKQAQLEKLLKQNSQLISSQQSTFVATPPLLTLTKRPVTPDQELLSDSVSTSTEKTIVKRPVTPDQDMESVRSNKRMRFLPVSE